MVTIPSHGWFMTLFFPEKKKHLRFEKTFESQSRLPSLLSLFVRLHATGAILCSQHSSSVENTRRQAESDLIGNWKRNELMHDFRFTFLFVTYWRNTQRNGFRVPWHTAFFCCSLSQSSRSFFSWSIRFLFSCTEWSRSNTCRVLEESWKSLERAQ